jgi:hypothetical protein
MQEFQQRINQIANMVKDLTSPDDLFRYPLFIEVYEAPNQFLEVASQLYADPKQPKLNKEITGYAMQRLPLDEFLQLVSLLFDLVNFDIIDAQLLETFAFPPLNWGAQLAMHYNHSNVNPLLQKLASSKKLNNRTRTYIQEDVLTGHAQEDIIELQEMGQIP